MSRLPIVLAVLLTASPVAAENSSPAASAPQHYTAPYDVIWTSPSHDAAGSMPLGNGQLGINLWVEEGGDLRFYISRTDSFTETARLVKVGGVRISLDPNPFHKGRKFCQHLVLHDGQCMITAGEGRDKVRFVVFVDSDKPVIHVACDTTSPAKVRIAADVWRTKPHTLSGEELNSSWTLHGSPTPVVEAADVFAETPETAVAWYHRNETSPAFASTMKVQSLESIANTVADPLLRRTFGGFMTAVALDKQNKQKLPLFTRDGEHAIGSHVPVQGFRLKIACPCLQTKAAADWLKEAERISGGRDEYTSAGDRTEGDWNAFWNRSRIIVSGDQAAGIPGSEHPLPNHLDGRLVARRDDAAAPSLTRAYLLQRYVMACGGSGPYPIKFNGTIFTVEPKAMGKPYNADWRAWGDCHWWQNVRFAYHTMLAGGDFEMMDPLFSLYESVRPLSEARARLYHGASGCYFPETMTVWGTYSNGDYGWNRGGHQPKDVLCPYWQYAWNQGPELVALMLDRWDYTGDEAFLTQRVLPMAESVLKYFDTRFKKDADGRIVLSPTQAVETYWYGVINDMPTTAGLNDITARLCALPERFVGQPQREFFRRMRAACPTVPVEEAKVAGRTVRRLAPAQKYNPTTSNCESPSLYAIWPFRLYGIGRPRLEEARAAYATRHNHLDVGWGYDGNCAALLGLTDEAARILRVKCANSHPAYRWPATWGPNFDWLPDQDHGGNILETTQLMLLQPVGNKLLVLPAWPKTWDVEFKLHAPRQTVVECVYRHGRIERLTVTPESRRADIVLPMW